MYATDVLDLPARGTWTARRWQWFRRQNNARPLLEAKQKYEGWNELTECSRLMPKQLPTCSYQISAPSRLYVAEYPKSTTRDGTPGRSQRGFGRRRYTFLNFFEVLGSPAKQWRPRVAGHSSRHTILVFNGYLGSLSPFWLQTKENLTQWAARPRSISRSGTTVNSFVHAVFRGGAGTLHQYISNYARLSIVFQYPQLTLLTNYLFNYTL